MTEPQRLPTETILQIITYALDSELDDFLKGPFPGGKTHQKTRNYHKRKARSYKCHVLNLAGTSKTCFAQVLANIKEHHAMVLAAKDKDRLPPYERAFTLYLDISIYRNRDGAFVKGKPRWKGVRDVVDGVEGMLYFLARDVNVMD